MANLLNEYHQKQEDIKKQITEGVLPVDSLLAMQELNYRVYVLETLQTFCKTAPVTEEVTVMSIHFQVLFAFICALLKEHTIGVKADEARKKKRETVKGNLETIIQDSRRQFQNFQMTTPDHYKRSVSSMINTILSAWLQYRSTYMEL